MYSASILNPDLKSLNFKWLTIEDKMTSSQEDLYLVKNTSCSGQSKTGRVRFLEPEEVFSSNHYISGER
jgi:hypothetical protein